MNKYRVEIFTGPCVPPQKGNCYGYRIRDEKGNIVAESATVYSTVDAAIAAAILIILAILAILEILEIEKMPTIHVKFSVHVNCNSDNYYIFAINGEFLDEFQKSLKEFRCKPLKEILAYPPETFLKKHLKEFQDKPMKDMLTKSLIQYPEGFLESSSRLKTLKEFLKEPLKLKLKVELKVELKKKIQKKWLAR